VIGRSVTGVEGDEEVVAFVQLLPDSPHTTTELAEHAARHLAPYKRASQFLLVTAMPLTPTGKVVQDELAKMAAHTAQAH
jgi:long-chain acyl-CoA synthetase